MTRETAIEKAKAMLSNQGHGSGTNYTTNHVAGLMADFHLKMKEEEKKPEYCTCGNPSKKGYIHFEDDEKLMYICVDCLKEVKL